MRSPLFFAISLAMAGCTAADASGNDAAARRLALAACEPGEVPLAQTGLCQHGAAALLFNPSTAPSGAMEGCDWVIREAPFVENVLLYRTLRCGKTETAIELQVGNHVSELTYTRRADGGAIADADGKPLVLAQIFAGHPDGRARALWEARDSIGKPRAAERCTLKPPYHAEGLPGDALIVDLARKPADLARDDAIPKCGRYGYNPAGGSIDFWRTQQGYAWFFSMGTDVWDIDPGSLTIVRRSVAGAWERAPNMQS